MPCGQGTGWIWWLNGGQISIVLPSVELVWAGRRIVVPGHNGAGRLLEEAADGSGAFVDCLGGLELADVGPQHLLEKRVSKTTTQRRGTGGVPCACATLPGRSPPARAHP